MEILKQIEKGLLVSPNTKQRLFISKDFHYLQDAEKTEQYQLLNGSVPILLTDEKWAIEYASDSARMSSEYTLDALKSNESLAKRIKSKLNQDYRTETSKKAFLQLFQGLEDDALCLSVGGGPVRFHSMLTNVNIGPFPNVDIVADAHCLPYADESVDVIHSEAVFEHLHTPYRAAQEMHRVLRPGGRAYVCTPFLQAYHGYPHHYQNYTLTGHCHLFDSVGFDVIESGTCVGPVYTIVSLVACFLATYPPYPFNYLLRYLWGGIGAIIRPMDLIVNKSKDSHIMASTTYAIIQKR